MPASVTPSTARAAKPGASTAGAAARLRAGPVQRGQADRSAPCVLAAAAGRRADGPVALSVLPAVPGGAGPGPALLSQPDGELRAQAVAAVVGAGGTRLPACPPSWISAARVKRAGPRAAGHVDGPGAAAVALGSRASARLYRADRCRAARDCSHQTMAAATR